MQETSIHASIRCDGRCLSCGFDDCISDNPPTVDLDEWVGFYSWEEIPLEVSDELPATVAENGLDALISDDLRRFCDEKGVEPRVRADIAILERAMREGFQGRKLHKALYKVRHRDKYRREKKRNRMRKKKARTITI